MLSAELGWRGYVFSRPMGGQEIPQRVQNLVLRDYAAKHRLRFLLSATEYAMPACYMMLDGALEQIEDVAGLIFYSTHQLPLDPGKRTALYRTVLDKGRGLRFALEDLAVLEQDDLAQLEDILLVRQLARTTQTMSPRLIRDTPTNYFI